MERDEIKHVLVRRLLEMESPAANSESLQTFRASFECSIRSLESEKLELNELYTILLYTKLPKSVSETVKRRCGDNWSKGVEKIALRGNLTSKPVHEYEISVAILHKGELIIMDCIVVDELPEYAKKFNVKRSLRETPVTVLKLAVQTEEIEATNNENPKTVLDALWSLDRLGIDCRVSSLRTAKNGSPLPSARLVSTKVNTKPNEESAIHSFILVTFGQFLDHDITATPLSRGYLGGPIKCCDDLRVKLDLAAINLNATKLALEEVEMIEPSLRTKTVLSELEVASKTLENLIAQGERLLENTQQVFNLTNLKQSLPFSTEDLKILNVLRPVDSECAPIPIPHDDEFYSCYGQTCMEFVRSSPAATCTFGPREQLNQNSAYLDGSVIYGSRKEITDSLRQLKDGLLKMQVTLEGKILLPGEENPDDGCNVHDKYADGFFCFRAGDGRVNEQILLVFMQTVWAREHNRIATVLKEFHQDWDDEKLFQETRRIVIAELQHVTYNEFLPAVLGNVLMETLKLKPLSGNQYTSDYDETLDAAIANSFATAAYRYGHSQISDFIQRINIYGVVETAHTSSMFFNPFTMYENEAVEDLGRGSTSYRARKVDAYFTEEVAGKLFKGSGKFGLDLVALNIQRGRDHGLPGYVHWKSLCGAVVSQFTDLSSVMDKEVIDSLQEVYSDLEDVDLYIGGVSERPFLDGILGPTFSCIIADQFLRMKRGDRFWYEYKDSPGAFTKKQLKELHKVTFARILCNNIPELITIQPYAFKIPSSTNSLVSCLSGLIGDYSLSPWQAY
ncbi:peroxinectin A-like [Macrobrachium rosenbergii]|uniref:peroxinectin A-like n=1 Tax=Macrobrachium rosenbergii TaxID=79674 RepID=UPI0034D5B8CC